MTTDLGILRVVASVFADDDFSVISQVRLADPAERWQAIVAREVPSGKGRARAA